MTDRMEPFRLFVYGTLMRGERNHARFCGGGVGFREAAIWGRLFDLPAGYPALLIPQQSIMATGTLDPVADAQRQAEVGCDWPQRPEGDWDIVHGELVEFATPSRDMPPIDELEEFVPDGSGLYRRVLVSVMVGAECAAAWVYCMDATPQGVRLPDGRWLGCR
ncbi:gamma-glutamylcyclotransferase (GGCT)/AIG2-like uncharacterized protein YtfP [Desulfobaculum xiamenense]|uniref:Gamma-glutamylcyclotransferase (GGCT)/AIG2-like uncharacterized protein YtfP n=1 Tax=Desulfobaculum xiamenense TaxID=995050 RepID=A0A846QER2_9BACT|nr:gamma-glutamylcyclotransferase [Desulfobaculum xiamenense]NJB66848.1 gamma-glutamylcyclotransferase (GGCT)/AIG2-like uncharacterized protein YtfP [Desulfobaculum xiamenense]